MDIEIALRLCCASLSRQTHEEITFPEDIVGIPVQVIFVNIEIRNILLGVPLKAAIYHLVEVAVQLAVCHDRGLLLNLLIVIDDFVHIDVILVIAVIVDDELA